MKLWRGIANRSVTMNDNAQTLIHIARGLVLVFCSLNLQLLGATLTLLAGFLVIGGFDLPIGPLAAMVHLFVILTATLFLSGLLYCLGAPIGQQALAAVGLSSVLAGVAVWTEFNSIWPEVRAVLEMQPAGMPQEHPVLTLGSSVSVGPWLLMTAHLLFVLFLRPLAWRVEEEHLASRALLVLVMQAVLTAAALGTLLLLSMGGDLMGKLPLVGFLWAGGLAMWGLYCHLLLNLRQALLRRAQLEVGERRGVSPT